MRMVEICVSEMSRITYRKGKCNIEDVFFEVCEIFNIEPQVVRSKKRTTNVFMCRYIVSYISYLMLDMNLERTAYFLGYKDHSPVAIAVKKVSRWISSKNKKFMPYWLLYTSKSEIWKNYDKR